MSRMVRCLTEFNQGASNNVSSQTPQRVRILRENQRNSVQFGETTGVRKQMVVERTSEGEVCGHGITSGMKRKQTIAGVRKK
jgi:hypothetical protein